MRSLKSMRFVMTVIFWISIVLVILIEFVFKEWEGCFDKATVAADLFIRLLTSYIASYLFFVIATNWDKVETKDAMAGSVEKRFGFIINGMKGMVDILNTLRAASKKKGTSLERMNREEFIEMCQDVAKVNQTNGSPFGMMTLAYSVWSHDARLVEVHAGQLLVEYVSFDAKRFHPLLDPLRSLGLHADDWDRRAPTFEKHFDSVKDPIALHFTENIVRMDSGDMYDFMQNIKEVVKYCDEKKFNSLEGRVQSIRAKFDERS